MKQKNNMFIKETRQHCELFGDEEELRNVDTFRTLLWKRINDSFDEKGILKGASDRENYKTV